MATYLIREENMERLEKKLAAIEKKCNKTKCSFHYAITGTEYKDAEDEDGNVYTYKYNVVDVEGTAKYNGWRFVATLDHHEEGNVIRAYDTELVIPEKYKTCGPTCEHCNKIRSRKDTYLVYNDETAEFRQVGRSCLKEFTNGLSAEDVAMFCQWYSEMEKGYAYSGPSSNSYISVTRFLEYAFECYKHWGYQKSASSFYGDYVPVGYRSTRDRVLDYYYINRAMSKQREILKAEMDEVGFNPDSEYATTSTEAALEWIRNEDPDSEYIRNLKVVCSDDYTDFRSLGILVSLTTAYNRHIGQLKAYEEKKRAQDAEKEVSDYISEVGQRIKVNVKDGLKCVSSWGSIYGMTYLYKFTDENNNVCIWYSSKGLDDEDLVDTVTGTVKDHSEYNGVKQTVLTRCKVTRKEREKVSEPEPGTTVEEAIDAFLEFVNS